MFDVSIVDDVVVEFLICELSSIVEFVSKLFSHIIEFVVSVVNNRESFICEFVELLLVRFEL